VPRGETDRERIARVVRSRIASGQLKPGDRVPSAAQLAESEGVHSRTAQHALSILKREGAITTHYGRGSFVAEKAPQTKPSVEDQLGALKARVERLEQERDPN
jgi:DNA-binding transcriptional regulator YhcF (GntR family)